MKMYPQLMDTIIRVNNRDTGKDRKVSKSSTYATSRLGRFSKIRVCSVSVSEIVSL